MYVINDINVDIIYISWNYFIINNIEYYVLIIKIFKMLNFISLK